MACIKIHLEIKTQSPRAEVGPVHRSCPPQWTENLKTWCNRLTSPRPQKSSPDELPRRKQDQNIEINCCCHASKFPIPVAERNSVKTQKCLPCLSRAFGCLARKKLQFKLLSYRWLDGKCACTTGNTAMKFSMFAEVGNSRCPKITMLQAVTEFENCTFHINL